MDQFLGSRRRRFCAGSLLERRPLIPPRDTQRRKLYAWEQIHVQTGPLITMSEARRLAHHVACAYGQSPPRLWIGGPRQTRTSAYFPGSHLIRFSPYHLTRATALHEMAHALLRKSTEASHGPLFVRLYVTLLVRYHLEDEARLLTSAEHTLQIAAEETLQAYFAKHATPLLIL